MRALRLSDIILFAANGGKEVVMRFKYGCRDGIPIMLGYLTVSFTFGVSCVAKGFVWWMPLLCSVTNFTGTGQFAGMDLIASAGSVAELIATMIVINARYALMGVSLSQKLDGKTRLWQRFIIAFGLTDENYAVAIRKPQDVTFSYFLGVMLTSFAGWVSGTLLGALAGNFLPESLLSAFGIALYGMFIAIVIPPCRTSKAIATVVLTAIAMSCLFYYVPGLNKLSSGWAIIICGIASALIGAVFFPIKPEDNKEKQIADGVIFGSKSVQDNNGEKDLSSDGNDMSMTENNEIDGYEKGKKADTYCKNDGNSSQGGAQ